MLLGHGGVTLIERWSLCCWDMVEYMTMIGA